MSKGRSTLEPSGLNSIGSSEGKREEWLGIAHREPYCIEYIQFQLSEGKGRRIVASRLHETLLPRLKTNKHTRLLSLVFRELAPAALQGRNLVNTCWEMTELPLQATSLLSLSSRV